MADFDVIGKLVENNNISIDDFLNVYGSLAYRCWKILELHVKTERKRRGLLNFLEQHPISSPAELEGAMKQLGLPFTREVIDVAITSLNDFVPESIREK